MRPAFLSLYVSFEPSCVIVKFAVKAMTNYAPRFISLLKRGKLLINGFAAVETCQILVCLLVNDVRKV